MECSIKTQPLISQLMSEDLMWTHIGNDYNNIVNKEKVNRLHESFETTQKARWITLHHIDCTSNIQKSTRNMIFTAWDRQTSIIDAGHCCHTAPQLHHHWPSGQRLTGTIPSPCLLAWNSANEFADYIGTETKFPKSSERPWKPSPYFEEMNSLHLLRTTKSDFHRDMETSWQCLAANFPIFAPLRSSFLCADDLLSTATSA